MKNEKQARKEKADTDRKDSIIKQSLAELKKLLGDGAIFIGTIDEYFDEIEKKEEGENNARR